ncbi:MAG: hypothetical protein O3A00_23945, partial [Planctomycetota bacterium]|nr:hypothetical protein [Planctomycetota bacterium]
QNLSLPFEASPGEPVSLGDHLRWEANSRGSFEFSGWLLKEVTIRSKSFTKPSGRNWDIDGSRPDLSYKVRSDGGLRAGLSGTKTDTQAVSWNPWLHIPRGEVTRIEVFDRDAFGGHDAMGTAKFDPQSGRMTAENAQFTVEAVWVKAHH